MLFFIILCSTSFYQISVLGPLQKGAELLGVVIIFVLMIFTVVYSETKSIKRNFILPVSLIILSVVTSMFMASFTRDQSFVHTLFAQRAMYYYFLYFLLHQFKTSPKDLERIFIVLGILYIFLYLLQYVLYPKIIYDAYVLERRGTIRIYLAGVDYMVVAFFFSVQYFLRTNKFKYLILLLGTYSIYILIGGRQTLAIMTFLLVMFIIIDRKVKSRLFLIFLGLVGGFAIFLIFQNIFEMLLMQSQSDTSLGSDYIRIRAARFYLTDFFEHPLAYITGNGMYHETSNYGREIAFYRTNYHFTLGDIGILGNYTIYGIFFIIGVLFICIRSLRIKIESQYIYLKYLIVSILLALITAGGFSRSDVICFIVCILYIIDVSNQSYKGQVLNLDQSQLAKNR